MITPSDWSAALPAPPAEQTDRHLNLDGLPSTIIGDPVAEADRLQGNQPRRYPNSSNVLAEKTMAGAEQRSHQYAGGEMCSFPVDDAGSTVDAGVGAIP